MKSLRKTGPASFTYALTHSKTNQSAVDRPENYKPLEGLAAEALQAWLKASGIQEGAIFRQVKKGGSVGAPLSAASVRDIVRQRATAAGLPNVYSAHSLRSGFVTEAATQNIPLADTMAMTSHRSVASVLGLLQGVRQSPRSLAVGASGRSRLKTPTTHSNQTLKTRPAPG